MKTNTRLALFLAATLPVALPATPISRLPGSNREYSPRSSCARNDHPVNEHPNYCAFTGNQPASVPDTGSTVLLVGAGLGGLILLRRKLVFQTQ